MNKDTAAQHVARLSNSAYINDLAKNGASADKILYEACHHSNTALAQDIAREVLFNEIPDYYAGCGKPSDRI